MKKTESDRKAADARDLFMLDRYTQQQICDMLGVSANTFTKWKTEGHWETILMSRRSSKDKLADILMKQILALDEQMQEEGRKVMTSKEVNQMWQLHNMLRKTEETGTAAAIVTTLTQFTDWIRTRYPEQCQAILALCDEYIAEQLSKER